ncbi:hypothetical protein ACN261_01110 [Micromonospora sp. WMMD723]|uniref:hypothetical protein n=1 Tax=Micromonospora sp. WMMD723 TaxID=3403465 RepID=UPI003CE74120
MLGRFIALAGAVVKNAMLYILIAGLCLYVLGMFLWRELGALQKYQVPFLATTLFFILVFVVAQTAVLDRHRQSLASIELNVSGLALLAEQAGRAVDVQVYEDDQVYEATRQAVQNARERVCVSYLRSHGPNPVGAAARHIQACREWALSSPHHRFRRVILHSDEEAMAEFLATELAAVRAAKAKGHRYGVKLLTESRHAAEAFSIGIYDDDLVIITYSTDSHRHVAFSIRSRDVVNRCFRFYFESLWGSATDIEKCIGTPAAAELPAPAEIDR